MFCDLNNKSLSVEKFRNFIVHFCVIKITPLKCDLEVGQEKEINIISNTATLDRNLKNFNSVPQLLYHQL